MIDLDNWRFENKPNMIAKLQNPDTPSTFLNFQSAKHLCEYISLHGRQFQRRINDCLHQDKTYKAWKSAAPALKTLPHFRKYRASAKSKLYHQAVKNIASGKYNKADEIRVYGLAKEISESPISLPKNQKLFHGFSFDIKRDIPPTFSVTINFFPEPYVQK